MGFAGEHSIGRGDEDRRFGQVARRVAASDEIRRYAKNSRWTTVIAATGVDGKQQYRFRMTIFLHSFAPFLARNYGLSDGSPRPLMRHRTTSAPNVGESSMSVMMRIAMDAIGRWPFAAPLGSGRDATRVMRRRERELGSDSQEVGSGPVWRWLGSFSSPCRERGSTDGARGPQHVGRGGRSLVDGIRSAVGAVALASAGKQRRRCPQPTSMPAARGRESSTALRKRRRPRIRRPAGISACGGDLLRVSQALAAPPRPPPQSPKLRHHPRAFGNHP